MVDHANCKLGRLPAKRDSRVPVFAKYLTAKLPLAPSMADWTQAVNHWGVLANDRLGDCTAAAAAHAIQTFTANASTEANITDEETIHFYSETTGYDPGDPNTDLGGVELDVLNWWLKNDFAGHRLNAFATLDYKNRTNIKDAIWLCGCIYIGVNLPLSARTQEIWDVPIGGPVGDGAPNSWGGHALAVVSYSDKELICVTWGELKRMTWDFFLTYTEEAYALISKEWLKSSGVSPSGFNYEQLIEDMNTFAQVDPLEDLQRTTDDPVLFEFRWDQITLDVRQAAATYVLGLIASAFATYGYMVDSNVSTFMGIVIGVMAGFHHLTTISKSNISTRELVEVFSDLISVLQKKRIH